MCRRFNCCVYNHPCPIWCPWVNFTCTNDVINPILPRHYGFFTNTAVGAIATQSIIPVNFVQGEGNAILPTGTGAVTLTAGTYEISYLAGGTVPASGTMSIKLRANGFDVPNSVLNATQTAGEFVNLTNTIVLTLTQTTTLELVNNSADTTTYSYANLLIKKM